VSGTTTERRGPVGRFAAVPVTRVHLLLMLALTFGTGVIDAVGYLGLDRVFTGNMTGNVVILGMAVVGADDLPILGPVVALLGFMAGAALAGRTLRSTGEAWGGRSSLLLGLVAVLMLGCAAGLAVVDDPDHVTAAVVTTVLGLAMGVQAAAARVVAVKDVTTVVVTSTLTGLASDSALGAGKPGSSARRVAAVVLILLGAAAGALALKHSLVLGLVLSGVLVTLVAVVGEVHRRLQPHD